MVVSAGVGLRWCVQAGTEMKLIVPSPSQTLGDDIEEAVRSVAEELGYSREQMLRVIVKEWLEKNAYLPVHELDEDGETDGTA